MDSERKPKLTPRGAPMMASHRLQLIRPDMKDGKIVDPERVDSGLGDSFKSERGSNESNPEGEIVLDELTKKMSLSENTQQTCLCDDASMNSRHPEPCSPPQTTSASPKMSPVMSPVQSVMNFAQSNDVRHLLAPYRHCLLVPNEDGDT